MYFKEKCQNSYLRYYSNQIAHTPFYLLYLTDFYITHPSKGVHASRSIISLAGTTLKKKGNVNLLTKFKYITTLITCFASLQFYIYLKTFSYLLIFCMKCTAYEAGLFSHLLGIMQKTLFTQIFIYTCMILSHLSIRDCSWTLNSPMLLLNVVYEFT